jgi:hypothetical protein
MVGYIIGGIALVITAAIVITSKVITILRTKEYSDWQVGDKVSLINTEDTLFTLVGWEKNSIYIEKDGTTHKIGWTKLHYNKSAIWRRNHHACEKAMGKEPGFAPGLGQRKNISGQVDGKAIELLSEIECQVYLKQAIETENYELAEKIRKQMEKYR